MMRLNTGLGLPFLAAVSTMFWMSTVQSRNLQLIVVVAMALGSRRSV